MSETILSGDCQETIQPYYQKDGITIYHGDCREILPTLPKVDLVLTDPPYGIDYAATQPNAMQYDRIHGDDATFDPRPLIDYSIVILWGANNYTKWLPFGGWLVWDKRVSEAADKMMGSPFELAWCSIATKFKIARIQHGGAKNADAPNGQANGKRFHPTQKPVRLMKWCMGLFPDAHTILDPFMGSGTTLRAAKDLGCQAIGIEIEEKYCEIAANRLHQGVLPFG